MKTEPMDCPRCGVNLSEAEVNYSMVDTDHNIAWQEVTCECGCSWKQEYDYSGFTLNDPEDQKLVRIFFDIKKYANTNGLLITIDDKSVWFKRYTKIPSWRTLHKDLTIILKSMKMSHDLINPDIPFLFSLIDVGGCLDGDPAGIDVTSSFDINDERIWI